MRPQKRPLDQFRDILKVAVSSAPCELLTLAELRDALVNYSGRPTVPEYPAGSIQDNNRAAAVGQPEYGVVFVDPYLNARSKVCITAADTVQIPATEYLAADLAGNVTTR